MMEVLSNLGLGFQNALSLTNLMWVVIGSFLGTLVGMLPGVGPATGIAILILIRHGASLGGLGVLAIYLQKTRGWRAGKLQMAADCLILGAAMFIRDPVSVGLSIVGALALNLVIAVNHKAGRYMGT